MRIDRNLNIVIPVDLDGGGQVFVHSMPISRDIFERYFLSISRAYSAMMMQKLTSFGALKVAYLLLKKTSQEALRPDGKTTEWEGEDGVERGLMPEVRRLTNVVMPGKDGGWQTVPFDVVRDQQLLSEEDIADVENVLVFFMLASHMSRRKDRQTVLGAAEAAWDAQITSLNCTEYKNSLPISKEEENTGEKANPLSIPH